MSSVKEAVADALTPLPPLKLDFGCGKNKREGFTGVDSRAFEGVDIVLDVVGRDEEGKFRRWPWDDNSIDEANASHVVEHFKPDERIHFVNELYRVLKPGASCQIVVPHWASCRAYGDLTHQWPPMSEFWFYYLKKEWRAVNAPHNDFYTCDFDATWGYSMHPSIMPRNQEYQMNAIAFWKEAIQDIIATLKKPA